jgi:hypothetical protein
LEVISVTDEEFVLLTAMLSGTDEEQEYAVKKLDEWFIEVSARTSCHN